MHVIGTAGHVDHGKSTLVQALTGIDPDRFAEEKRRGLTIDLGFAWFTLPSGREVGIVDVPGHERFIRNMLAGVGAIDAVLFVVAADEGFMPQSSEHLAILDFLEISGGVVALTKADTVEEDALELVREDTWQRLRSTCLHDAAIVAVSAKTGAGLDNLRITLDDLLARTTPAPDDGRPSMFVDRSFTIAGAGTVVTGTLTGGRLRVGDEITILPDGHRSRIRSLQTHRRAVDEAVPGSRVAANLVGLERTEIVRGDALVTGRWISTATFAARLHASGDLGHAITERGAYELYLGSAEVSSRLKFLEDRSDGGAIVPVNDEGGLVAGLRPGASLLVQLYCARELVATVGDRFVLRDVGRRTTVAGGVVLDQVPGDIRRGDEAEIRRLRERENLRDRAELAAQIVRERGIVRKGELEALAGTTEGVQPLGPAHVVDPVHLRTLRRAAREIVAKHHAEHPLAAGIAVDELKRELGLDDVPIDELLDGVERDGSVIRVAGRRAVLGDDRRAAADRALDEMRRAGSSPPGPRELGLGVELVKLLERTGELVVVAPDIAYPVDVWRGIEAQVVQMIREKGPVSVADVRNAIGTSRKYAVPLLEKLDAMGITRRNGDVRDLGPRGRELA